MLIEDNKICLIAHRGQLYFAMTGESKLVSYNVPEGYTLCEFKGHLTKKIVKELGLKGKVYMPYVTSMDSDTFNNDGADEPVTEFSGNGQLINKGIMAMQLLNKVSNIAVPSATSISELPAIIENIVVEHNPSSPTEKLQDIDFSNKKYIKNIKFTKLILGEVIRDGGGIKFKPHDNYQELIIDGFAIDILDIKREYNDQHVEIDGYYYTCKGARKAYFFNRPVNNVATNTIHLMNVDIKKVTWGDEDIVEYVKKEIEDRLNQIKKSELMETINHAGDNFDVRKFIKREYGLFLKWLNSIPLCFSNQNYTPGNLSCTASTDKYFNYILGAHISKLNKDSHWADMNLEDYVLDQKGNPDSKEYDQYNRTLLYPRKKEIIGDIVHYKVQLPEYVNQNNLLINQLVFSDFGGTLTKGKVKELKLEKRNVYMPFVRKIENDAINQLTGFVTYKQPVNRQNLSIEVNSSEDKANFLILPNITSDIYTRYSLSFDVHTIRELDIFYMNISDFYEPSVLMENSQVHAGIIELRNKTGENIIQNARYLKYLSVDKMTPELIAKGTNALKALVVRGGKGLWYEGKAGEKAETDVNIKDINIECAYGRVNGDIVLFPDKNYKFADFIDYVDNNPLNIFYDKNSGDSDFYYENTKIKYDVPEGYTLCDFRGELTRDLVREMGLKGKVFMPNVTSFSSDVFEDGVITAFAGNGQEINGAEDALISSSGASALKKLSNIKFDYLAAFMSSNLEEVENIELIIKDPTMNAYPIFETCNNLKSVKNLKISEVRTYDNIMYNTNYGLIAHGCPKLSVVDGLTIGTFDVSGMRQASDLNNESRVKYLFTSCSYPIHFTNVDIQNVEWAGLPIESIHENSVFRNEITEMEIAMDDGRLPTPKSDAIAKGILKMINNIPFRFADEPYAAGELSCVAKNADNFKYVIGEKISGFKPYDYGGTKRMPAYNADYNVQAENDKLLFPRIKKTEGDIVKYELADPNYINKTGLHADMVRSNFNGELDAETVRELNLVGKNIYMPYVKKIKTGALNETLGFTTHIAPVTLEPNVITDTLNQYKCLIIPHPKNKDYVLGDRNSTAIGSFCMDLSDMEKSNTVLDNKKVKAAVLTVGDKDIRSIVYSPNGNRIDYLSIDKLGGLLPTKKDGDNPTWYDVGRVPDAIVIKNGNGLWYTGKAGEKAATDIAIEDISAIKAARGRTNGDIILFTNENYTYDKFIEACNNVLPGNFYNATSGDSNFEYAKADPNKLRYEIDIKNLITDPHHESWSEETPMDYKNFMHDLYKVGEKPTETDPENDFGNSSGVIGTGLEVDHIVDFGPNEDTANDVENILNTTLIVRDCNKKMFDAFKKINLLDETVRNKVYYHYPKELRIEFQKPTYVEFMRIAKKLKPIDRLKKEFLSIAFNTRYLGTLLEKISGEKNEFSGKAYDMPKKYSFEDKIYLAGALNKYDINVEKAKDETFLDKVLEFMEGNDEVRLSSLMKDANLPAHNETGRLLNYLDEDYHNDIFNDENTVVIPWLRRGRFYNQDESTRPIDISNKVNERDLAIYEEGFGECIGEFVAGHAYNMTENENRFAILQPNGERIVKDVKYLMMKVGHEILPFAITCTHDRAMLFDLLHRLQSKITTHIQEVVLDNQRQKHHGYLFLEYLNRDIDFVFVKDIPGEIKNNGFGKPHGRSALMGYFMELARMFPNITMTFGNVKDYAIPDAEYRKPRSISKTMTGTTVIDPTKYFSLIQITSGTKKAPSTGYYAIMVDDIAGTMVTRFFQKDENIQFAISDFSDMMRAYAYLNKKEVENLVSFEKIDLNGFDATMTSTEFAKNNGRNFEDIRYATLSELLIRKRIKLVKLNFSSENN